jgi:hypothetical protein
MVESALAEPAVRPATSTRAAVPRAIRILGEELLDQQLWFCGRDVLHEGGNGLLRFGFDRVRPPASHAAASAYVLPLDDGRRVVLWGFGVFYGDDALGGLFLRRYGFGPRLTPAAAPRAAFAPSELPPLRAPVTDDEARLARALLTATMRWVAAYERWAQATFGLPFRRRCIAERPRRKRRRLTVAPAQLPEAWDAIAAWSASGAPLAGWLQARERGAALTA